MERGMSMSSVFRFLAAISALLAFFSGIFYGFLANGLHLGSALLIWLSGGTWAFLLLAVSILLDQQEETLQHLRILTRDSRYQSELPPKLGNSKMNLDALKDYRMSVKDED